MRVFFAEDHSGTDFYWLTVIQFQGEINQWLQREYGEDAEVQYTLYKEYLGAERQCRNFYIKYRAHLSDLLINLVIFIIHIDILHEDAWYPPENPEFQCHCIIGYRGQTHRVCVLLHRYLHLHNMGANVKTFL